MATDAATNQQLLERAQAAADAAKQAADAAQSYADQIGHAAGAAAHVAIWARIFGLIALALASVNIFGGFLVTERMLGMYKKKG